MESIVELDNQVRNLQEATQKNGEELKDFKE